MKSFKPGELVLQEGDLPNEATSTSFLCSPESLARPVPCKVFILFSGEVDSTRCPQWRDPCVSRQAFDDFCPMHGW